GGLAHHIGLFADGHTSEAALLGILERSSDDSPRRGPRNHPHAHCEVWSRNMCEPLEFGVRSQCSPDVLRRIRPLDSGIHPFRILTKNRCIDFRLVELAMEPRP